MILAQGWDHCMKRRHNILLWLGFVVVLLAVSTYIPIFAIFAATRDIPWVNYLLFLAGGVLLFLGWRRAFRQPDVYRGKVLGSILTSLSVLLFAFFVFVILYISKAIPASESAVRVGQIAPDFMLVSSDGKQVSLSDQLKTNRAVVLIFYRGYW
jgi:hypothetical protein